MKKFKKGDRRMIYQDPITCLHPEGRATLVKRKKYAEPRGCERWMVRFDGWDETLRERLVTYLRDIPGVE